MKRLSHTLRTRLIGAGLGSVLSALLLLAGLIGFTTPAAAEELLVKLVAGLTADQQADVIARNGGNEVSQITALRLHVIEVPPAELDAAIASYEADAEVERVELNATRKADSEPVGGWDPLYIDQWYLPQIDWDLPTLMPSGNAVVALLDTGVDATHPDLAGKVLAGTSILDGGSGTTDPSGHGTQMAGIIAAVTNNGEGGAGVAYAGVKVLPVTVLGADATGQDSDVIAGVMWAADNGADVILMAFSNPTKSGSLQDALDYAWGKGVVLVAATGNAGSADPTFPAGHRGVMGISATTQVDSLAPGSNHGLATFLGAPGIDILTTGAGHSYIQVNGTSASAAIVAGVAGFMKAADPGLSNGVIVGRLGRTADPAGTQDETGNGRVNMARALADTGTESVQPAGVEGGGGPILEPYEAAGNARFSGTVKDTNNAGISGATVNCSTGCNGPFSTTTDSLGAYSFTPEFAGTTGTIALTASKAGYTSAVVSGISVSNRGTYQQNFILQPSCTAPSVSSQPTNQTVTYGATGVTFVAAATGTPTPTVQWEVSTDAGSTWSDVSGAISTTLSISAPTVAMSGNQYRAVFTNDCDGPKTATTNAATLTVIPRPITVTADPKSKVYGEADPALTYQITSGSLVAGDSFSGALTREVGENVGTYAIQQGTLALSSNYILTYVGANLTITARPITVTADAKSKVLNALDPELTYQITSGSLVTGDSFSGALTRVAGESVGQYDILQGTLTAGSNYLLTYVGAKLSIVYASGDLCYGALGHTILQPINADGSSVFKQKSTVPAKFRVCDANGISIGTPGVVTSFTLIGKSKETVAENPNETVISTTPDSAFRWSPTDQQWIFNLNTKNLTAGYTYMYKIALNDGSNIEFHFGLK